MGDIFAGVKATLTVASFTSSDPNAAACQFSATVDWGDGTAPDQNVTVTGSNGSFTVQGSHTYATDSLDQVDCTYGIYATISGPQGEILTQTKPVRVVRPSLAAFTNEVVIKAGVALTDVQVAAFTEPDLSDPSSEFTATIDWGDGLSSDGTVVGSGGNFRVLGSHTYTTSDDFVIGVTISQGWQDQKDATKVDSRARAPWSVSSSTNASLTACATLLTRVRTCTTIATPRAVIDYGKALITVRPLLDHFPALQNDIDTGLAEASRMCNPIDQAWRLRKVLDNIRETFRGQAAWTDQKGQIYKFETSPGRIEFGLKGQASYPFEPIALPWILEPVADTKTVPFGLPPGLAWYKDKTNGDLFIVPTTPTMYKIPLATKNLLGLQRASFQQVPRPETASWWPTNPDNVKQHARGDCFLIATIVTLAQRHPGILTGILQPVTENGSNYWQVKFPGRNRVLIPPDWVDRYPNPQTYAQSREASPFGGTFNWAKVIELGYIASTVQGNWGQNGFSPNSPEVQAETSRWLASDAIPNVWSVFQTVLGPQNVGFVPVTPNTNVNDIGKFIAAGVANKKVLVANTGNMVRDFSTIVEKDQLTYMPETQPWGTYEQRGNQVVWVQKGLLTTGWTPAVGKVAKWETWLPAIHAYTITNCMQDGNGIWWIQMRNPWGENPVLNGEWFGQQDAEPHANDGYFWLPADEFRKAFVGVFYEK